MRAIVHNRAGDRALWRRLTLACLALGVAALVGCSGQSDVNPVLRLDDPDKIRDATDRGKKLQGGDLYSVYRKTTQDLNIRISKDVILKSATICLPADAVAFAVASLPANSDDAAVKKAVDDAVALVNEQAKFQVVLQLDKSFDPKQVQFELRTNGGQTYPPTAVPQPQLIQDMPASIDGDIPAASVYGYEVFFQTTGSPGYPAIGTDVSTLTLAVKTESTEATASFTLPQATQ